MKKTMMIAALFAASTFAACAADVYSSNVVGYTKLGVAASNYTMLGVNFQAVGGGDLTINELFPEPSENAFVGGTGFAESDQLRVWDPVTTGYKQYFFGDWAGVYGAEYDNLWYWTGDEDNPTTDTLPPGAAVWYLSKGVTGPTIAVAGEVKGTTVTNVLTAAGYTMVANPFPVEVPINTLFAEPSENAFVGGPGFAESDQIRVWDPQTTGYKAYFFGDWSGVYGAEYDNKWYWTGDEDNPTTDTIPVGGAVWFLSKGVSDVELVLQSPVAP